MTKKIDKKCKQDMPLGKMLVTLNEMTLAHILSQLLSLVVLKLNYSTLLLLH